MKKYTKVAIGVAAAIAVVALVWPKTKQAVVQSPPPAPPDLPPPPVPAQPSVSPVPIPGQGGAPTTTPPAITLPPPSLLGGRGRAVVWQWFSPENEWRILSSTAIGLTDVVLIGTVLAALPFYIGNAPPYQCIQVYTYVSGAWSSAGLYCNY